MNDLILPSLTIIPHHEGVELLLLFGDTEHLQVCVREHLLLAVYLVGVSVAAPSFPAANDLTEDAQPGAAFGKLGIVATACSCRFCQVVRWLGV